MISFEREYHEKPSHPFTATGQFFLENLRCIGMALIIMTEAFRWFVHLHKRRTEVFRNLYIVGIKSFGVISIVAVFTGMILTLQTGLELKNYGQEVNVGIIVTQTLCREMGPFMTALILAASVGSAIAAELGTMSVSEEIDALKVMSINPVRYLVMPRLFAMLLMCPILTIYTNVIGVCGGGFVANTQLDVGWTAFYRNAINSLEIKEIYVGLFKALIFGIIVGTISCYQGLATTNGAIGVGRATRKAVVMSFLMVLIVGYMLTRLFY
jgi:phospholipid/cholesterol/gamma-HCH transport system permease protein